jgi:O-methyltransferase
MRIKRLLPTWFKAPFRSAADSLLRQGAYFELKGRRDLICKAMITLDFNGIAGDYCEFGCCGASTFGFASEALRRTRRTPRQMWAFDSFAGLPPTNLSEDQHPAWIAGTMKMGLDDFRATCARKGIMDYHVVPGYYSETLPSQPREFLPAGAIAFAYVDCDMYSSTLEVLTFLRPRLQHGMILAFDDWWCYSNNDLSGERKAFDEILRPCPEWRFEQYLTFGWSGLSFVVERARS